MEFEILKDKIVINSLEDFSVKHILECGQVFRYKKYSDTEYDVYSVDKKAHIRENQQDAVIYTDNPEYFAEYFDLKTDYGKIKSDLISLNLPFVNIAIENCYGIRILKQNLLETFISFMISSNNNIKRIELIIDRLCTKYGERVADYYAFPTLEKLKSISEEDFRELGLGYRAKYLYNSIKSLTYDKLEMYRNLDGENLRKELLTYLGIGEKVADCITLFGYHKFNVFPTDVWIEKSYNSYIGNETNRSKISKNLTAMFGDLSGYAQQYIFYYKRSIESK